MNYSLFHAINALTGNGVVDTVMKVAARYLIFVVFLVLAGLGLRSLLRRQLRPVILTGAALSLTFVLGLVAAVAYAEKRPFQSHHVHQLIAHAPGQSFPSDHATAAFGVAFAVTLFLSRRWGAILTMLALWIGFARVYDGIHYPLDIAGGILAATLGISVVTVVDRRLGGRRDQGHTSVAVRDLELSQP